MKASCRRTSDSFRGLSAHKKHARASSHGCMLGYSDRKGPCVSPFFRFLAKVGNEKIRMQILHPDFGRRCVFRFYSVGTHETSSSVSFYAFCGQAFSFAPGCAAILKNT